MSVRNEGTTLCRQCRGEIPADARLCRHCNSYQDWRGYLSLSSTVLALLVAFMSVASIAVPVLLKATKTPNSKVIVSTPVVDGETIYFVASNLGNRPGVVSRATMISGYLGGQTDIQLRSAPDVFVPPGSRQVAFNVHLQMNVFETLKRQVKTSEFVPNSEDVAAQVIVWATQANGDESPFIFYLKRLDVRKILEAHRIRCQDTAAPSDENGCWSLDDSIRAVHAASQEALKAGRWRPSSERRSRPASEQKAR